MSLLTGSKADATLNLRSSSALEILSADGLSSPDGTIEALTDIPPAPLDPEEGTPDDVDCIVMCLMRELSSSRIS